MESNSFDNAGSASDKKKDIEKEIKKKPSTESKNASESKNTPESSNINANIHPASINPESIQYITVQTTSTPSNNSLGLWISMVIIALLIYNMRNKEHTRFNGYGILLCIVCCPQLYILYVLVDLFIN